MLPRCLWHIPGSRMGLEGPQHPLGCVQAAVPVATGSASVPPGALRIQQSETTGQIPSDWSFWLVYVPQIARPWVRDARSIPSFQWRAQFLCLLRSLLQHCLHAQPRILPGPQPCSAFSLCECFSVMQNTILKASHFLQLLIDVCVSSGLFSLRLMKGSPLNWR